MILTIDQGTTSTRALIIDSGDANNRAPKILGISQKEFKQIFPKPGWVEHDPEEIYETTLEVCRDLIKRLLEEKKISKNDISSIAITNQRETTIVWNKKTGKPVYNAIVWQCRRTADFCKNLREKHPGFKDLVRKRTGLLIDSYFSGPKLSWILDYMKEEDISNLDDYIFGTIDSWLLWKLTNGASHYTEASNASRTMLYDIEKDKWDTEILDTLKIPRSMLPEVIASNSNFGETNAFYSLIGKKLPIKAMLGDQQAALNGYSQVNELNAKAKADQAKITYGTGTFILIPSSELKLVDGLVTSIAYKLSNGQKAYAIEGSIFIGGAIVQWLRDGLGIIKSSSEIENLALSVEDNGDVYLIPALAGLGAPHWREDVRGAIYGLSRASNKAHIARAALESIAYSVKDICSESIMKDFNIKSINVDGGASLNNLLMQFQADLLHCDIKRHQEKEMSAIGVAMMTGELEYQLELDSNFKPETDQNENYSKWSGYLAGLL